jgi:membrane associated rhomboid family serine protease
MPMSPALFFDLLLSLVFLLPLKDERTGKRFPLMTTGLVVVNTILHVVFHYLAPTWIGTESWGKLARAFLLTPADVLEGVGLGAASIITSTFLHADWGHLLGNMFFLFFFGRKVEDLIGPWKFVLFYLVCAFFADTASILGGVALPLTQGKIPSLGASGAIMGVIAAYFFLYSEQRIRTLVILAILPIPFTLKLPAWVFIIHSVLRDITGSLLQQEAQAMGYLWSLIGFFAHLGGFGAGLVCLYLFLPAEVLYYRRRTQRL